MQSFIDGSVAENVCFIRNRYIWKYLRKFLKQRVIINIFIFIIFFCHDLFHRAVWQHLKVWSSYGKQSNSMGRYLTQQEKAKTLELHKSGSEPTSKSYLLTVIPKWGVFDWWVCGSVDPKGSWVEFKKSVNLD